nr:MAG TPA: cytochrome c-552 [Caudoviricetes sp.]
MVIFPFQDNISFQKPLCSTKSAALRLPLFPAASTWCAVCHAK